jgi:hypothetical protein
MFLWSGQKGKDAMKTDATIGRGGSVEGYRHPVLNLMSPYLADLSDQGDPAARRWTPRRAAWAAVLMACEASHPLFIRLQNILPSLQEDFTGVRAPGTTYNGLIKALLRQAPTLPPAFRTRLREHVRQALDAVPRVHGWTLLAVDGSKEELPRTGANEQAFGIADNGRCPQSLLSVIVEVHTGLAWDWRIDAARGSEKDHLRQMAPDLPAGPDFLLLADANYVGYDLWATLAEAGRWFLIRVGGNVRLLTGLFPDAQVVREGRSVWVWPQGQQGHAPPLQLRLIQVGTRKSPVWLLTNVLEEKRLTVRDAGEIYRLRWGAETYYRGFKRTLGWFKLRSRSGERAKVELEWALIACTLLGLVGVREVVQKRQDPGRLSLAGVVHALRQALRGVTGGSPARRLQELRERLAGSLKDTYQRRAAKRSRHRPRTKSTPKAHRLKPPQRRRATAKEKRRARTLWPKLAA